MDFFLPFPQFFCEAPLQEAQPQMAMKRRSGWRRCGVDGENIGKHQEKHHIHKHTKIVVIGDEQSSQSL